LLRRLLPTSAVAAPEANGLDSCWRPVEILTGARGALVRFDEIAKPGNRLGRLALFDMLAKTGRTSVTALAKAVS